MSGKARPLISFSVMNTRFGASFEAREVGGRDGQVAQAADAQARVEHAEAHQGWFDREAMALLEDAGADERGVDGVGGLYVVEQIGKQRPVGLDELGVDAGDVELAQVEAGARMVAEPGEDGEDALPVFGVLQQAHGVAREPVRQAGKPLQCKGRQTREALGVPALADQAQGVLFGVDPRAGGQPVAAELAMVDVRPFDFVAGALGDLAAALQSPDPLANLVEPFRQRPDIRLPEFQDQRIERLGRHRARRAGGRKPSISRLRP